MKNKFAALVITLFVLVLAIDNVTTQCLEGCECNQESTGKTCRPKQGSNVSPAVCLAQYCYHGYC
uniref:Putative neurotoxin 5 n=1 Tax=Scolopendra mutilans TaxID=2836329 RepID=PNX65_SCOMU|nr:RecName: Full=Putative neurotoxin 5; AltName: Full=Putative neurotoxin 6; Flags: Precursor [Scolopendra mutilans]AFM55025.1 putative neurotoxin 6 [Scolopendra subspinipes]